MTTISLIQPTDVAVLKCIFFQMVKTLMEIDWYGLDCNRETLMSDIDSGFVYLSIINTQCTLEHRTECEIKKFITKKSSFCIFSNDGCEPMVTDLLGYRLTQNDDVRITEDSKTRIING